MDAERVGRALIEYSAIPLAVFMAVGIVADFLTRGGASLGFFDPMKNLPFFYVINFWLVMGVYWYRKTYRQDIVFEMRRETALALLAGLTWIILQPLLLLAGYAFYLKAIWQKDQVAPLLHSSLLPDMPSIDEEEEALINQ